MEFYLENSFFSYFIVENRSQIYRHSICVLFRSWASGNHGGQVTFIWLKFFFFYKLRNAWRIQFPREMVLANKWPRNMTYLMCDSYTGSNTPMRSINLQLSFLNVKVPATYGSFTLKKGVDFNGGSRLKFDMDILGVAVRNGKKCRERKLGNWTADFSSPFRMHSMRDMGELNAEKVYRVSTVVVKYICIKFKTNIRYILYWIIVIELHLEATIC